MEVSWEDYISRSRSSLSISYLFEQSRRSVVTIEMRVKYEISKKRRNLRERVKTTNQQENTNETDYVQ